MVTQFLLDEEVAYSINFDNASENLSCKMVKLLTLLNRLNSNFNRLRTIVDKKSFFRASLFPKILSPLEIR